MEVIVRDSPIQGKGVFAARAFKKGEVILQWNTSEKISSEDFTKMPEGDKRYVAYLNNTYVIMQSPEKYVNHSCEANTTARDFCDVAIKDIEKGEEITGDYAEEMVPGERIICNCGSKKCRGVIKKSPSERS